MNIQVSGYAINTLKQALQESTMLWQERIDQAERGERQNLSIEGARAMQDDLRDILEQIRLQDAWPTGTREPVQAPHSCYDYRVINTAPMTEMTFYVMFHSEELTEPLYEGPFYKLEDAEDYADHQNQGLANAGVPGSVASYEVVWTGLGTLAMHR